MEHSVNRYFWLRKQAVVFIKAPTIRNLARARMMVRNFMKEDPEGFYKLRKLAVSRGSHLPSNMLITLLSASEPPKKA